MSLCYLISLGNLSRNESFALIKKHRAIAEPYVVNYKVVEAFEKEFIKYDHDIVKLYNAIHSWFESTGLDIRSFYNSSFLHMQH